MNTSVSGVNAAPAEATMSKGPRTCVPLMETAKTRWPGAVK